MASSSLAKENVSYDIGQYPIAFKLTVKEGMKITSQPSSSDEAILKNWQNQLVIPFVVDKKLLAFHGTLIDAKSSPTKVAPFFPGYKPVMPPAFDRSVALDVKFMEAKARGFLFVPTHGNKEYLA